MLLWKNELAGDFIVCDICEGRMDIEVAAENWKPIFTYNLIQAVDRSHNEQQP